MISRSHLLDDFLGFRFRQAALVGDDLDESGVDLARHVGGITTDVEIGLVMLKQVVDTWGVFAQSMLHVLLLGPFAGEDGDELEGWTEDLAVFLSISISQFSRGWEVSQSINQSPNRSVIFLSRAEFSWLSTSSFAYEEDEDEDERSTLDEVAEG